MEELLSRMQQLNLPKDVIRHDPVMTVDEQAQALQGHPGSVTKNIFLKDKKGRLYLITALPTTKVDLKTLGIRLGLPKNAIRFAPEELLPSVLGVPLGSATPLAIASPTASKVVLLLDKNIQDQQTIYVHPLDNSASLAMSPSELETFIKSTGDNRQVLYVDFEAQLKIDKDNPPDLKWIADAAQPAVEEDSAEQQQQQQQAAPTKSKPSKSKSAAPTKTKTAAAVPRINTLDLTDKIIEKIMSGLGVEIAGDSTQQDILRRLKADVAMELNVLRNASYSAGYTSARSTMVAQLQGQLS